MLPALGEGDWVEVQVSSVRSGCMLAVRHDSGVFMVHRVVRVYTAYAIPGLLTRGDNMPYCDPPWRPDQVIGVVTRIIRPDGDFAPDNRITMALRLRWAYLTLRWYAGRVKRRLERALGRHRPLPPAHSGLPQGEAPLAPVAATVEPDDGERLRGQAPPVHLEGSPD